VLRPIRLAVLMVAALLATRAVGAPQDGLVPVTDVRGPVLQFDWPDIQIGIGSYEDGPTGLTIIRFMHRAGVVVDSRGGAPGTVNTDLLRLGYDAPRMDAIVFSGGSYYGEEAITATMTGLKDAGLRNGTPDYLANAAGAIIYDFGGRRLNDIYPDKKLAQATLHALRPGVFPLGAQGAGRMAMQGGFFGCLAHSGQGAAFRELNGVKIAAFVVVNAFGSVVDRQGNIVSCHPARSWGSQSLGGVPKIAELMTRVPLSRRPDWVPERDAPTHRNTTVSLIVTNAKLGYAELQRLAIQVHTSMARGIQPFSTFDDGDTLFAASTGDVPATGIAQLDLDTLAGETMWDAILASVPQDPAFDPPRALAVPPEQLRAYVGTYQFGPHVRLQVIEQDGALRGMALEDPVFEFRPGALVRMHAESATEFYVDRRYHTRLSFVAGPDGKATGVTLNPGRWAQEGKRLPD
jgi:L-aminopeptidase/D-esterase-like protein